MPKILVIGSTNVDFVMRMDRLPARGETVTDAQFLQTFGGKGANTAVSAARTGPAHKTTFITALGDDLYAPTLLANFKADHLDTSHIILRKNLATGSALIMCDKDGANYLSVAPGSNYALTPADIDKDAGLIRTANLVILQMEIRVDTLQRILQLCEDAGVPVLFNFAPVRTTEIPVSSQMTGLVVNEHEAGKISGFKIRQNDGALDTVSLRHAAGALLQMGIRELVVIHFPEGAFARTRKGEDVWQSSLKVPQKHIVGTAGAGDAFAAGILFGLHENWDLSRCLLTGISVAASSLSEPSCTAGVKPLAACQALVKKYGVRSSLEPSD